MDPAQVAAGLASNPLAWISAILIGVVAYLFKELRAADRLQLERSDIAKAAHLATLEKVIPIAEKLTSAVEILEKLSLREGQ